ncbi:MAG: hypothetical protein DWQ34_13925 [Planctomycetota bacterium]|nr:MAG: hypothetical protein DWQ34_13925 [Planctomycetota bacterium]REK21174.1 MAG: hypothetical protein DWQ41_22445 [Planctomycetota bacterium]REK29582.1 MAG: hypothetical protein DWQ45_22480 [Planctomycetota bacterium]
MGKANCKYVARAIPGKGWRVWNRRTKKWWGNPFREYPEELLAELNGPKRPQRLVQLCKRN